MYLVRCNRQQRTINNAKVHVQNGTVIREVILYILWTPLMRPTSGPAQGECCDRTNLVGEVGKKQNIYEFFPRHILIYTHVICYLLFLLATKRKKYD